MTGGTGLAPNRNLWDLYAAFVARVNRLFGIIAGVLVMVIVGVVVLAILAREVGIPLIWAQDVAQVAFIWLVFLSLAPGLESGHHVTVELFEPIVPQGLCRHLDSVAALACLLFGLVFLAQLWALTSRSMADGRLALMTIQIQLKWLQLAGPIGLVQFCLTAIMQLGRALQSRDGERPVPTAGHS